MKYIKKYNEEFDWKKLNPFRKLNEEEKVKKWLDNMNIKKYTINDNLTVDVDGDVSIVYQDLKSIPVKFNIVKGDFNCYKNELTDYKGFPRIIGGSSDFSFNKMNSFIGFPEKIGLDFSYGYYDNVKKIYSESNPIKEIIDCLEGPFDICKMINYINEYDVISGKNIFLDKYRECLELIGVPDDEIFLYEEDILDIKGYKIIE